MNIVDKVKEYQKARLVRKQNQIFQNEYCKKAVLSYPPRHITIGISSACNNKCLFCSYHGKDAAGVSNASGLPYMLSLEDFKRMVDMAKDAGVPRVHVCATGEPFLHPNILDMIDYVIEKYGKVTFQTNFWKKIFDEKGYLDEIVKRADHIACITTDILSSDPEEHEKIKNGASYEELLAQLAYISKRSNIPFNAVCILTRSNHDNIIGLVKDIHDKGIKNFELQVTNLLSYDYSEYTSSDNVYTSLDEDITAMLQELKKEGEKYGVRVLIPEPADKTETICPLLWEKFQTWPVKGCDKERYGENMILVACAAVIRGELNSLGYLFDYDNLMDAWNNEKLVRLRQDLLDGKYPSDFCRNCHLYHKEDGYYKQKVKKAQSND